MKETDQIKTSLEELKSKSRPERSLLKVCRWILACQYAILAFIMILMIFSGQFSSVRKLHTDTKANKFKSLTYPSSKVEPPGRINSVTKITNTKIYEKDDDLSLLGTIESNPFRLSTKDIMQQMRSAKIPSLRNRVKRFACWHSCFGQFHRKAFRTLYPKPVVTPPTLMPPITIAPEESEKEDKKDEKQDEKADEKKDEKKEEKREAKDGGETTYSTPLPGNNDLAVGEPKAVSDVNGTNSKPNTTDFFKLKTKEKESVKLANDSSSSINTEQHHPKENPEGNESDIEKKVAPASNDESVHIVKAVVVKSQEVSESEEGDYEESESRETENESEISVSEEALEDKGDGIDKKDMEAEKSR